MVSKHLDRPVASLQTAPIATLTFILGNILLLIGGILAPWGTLMWIGVAMCMCGGVFLKFSSSEIEMRIVQIKTSRLGR